MKKLLTILFLLGVLVLAPLSAYAHCDAADDPVATAALKALETKNLNLVLPYVLAAAEPELTATFEQALLVRTGARDAKALADRYFTEAAVRLHRAGEKAPYTGLKPAGTDFGPAIPAAEKALQSGALDRLVKLISQEVARGIAEHFEHARAKKGVAKEPTSKSGVQAARERVSAELDFIGYVERMYLATKASGHAE